SLDAAVVGVLVKDDVILAADQGRNDAVPRRPSGWKQDDVWEAEQFRHGSLQPRRQRRVSLQHRRSGGLRAVLIDSLDGGGSDFRVRSQPKVVVRSEVQAGPFAPGLIGDSRLGSESGLKLGSERPHSMV